MSFNTGEGLCVKLLLKGISVLLSMALWGSRSLAVLFQYHCSFFPLLTPTENPVLLLLLNFMLRLYGVQVMVLVFQSVSFQDSKHFEVSYWRNKTAQQTDLQYLSRINVSCVFCSCVNRAIRPVSDIASFTLKVYFRLWFSAPVYLSTIPSSLSEQCLLGMFFCFWHF